MGEEKEKVRNKRKCVLRSNERFYAFNKREGYFKHNFKPYHWTYTRIGKDAQHKAQK